MQLFGLCFRDCHSFMEGDCGATVIVVLTFGSAHGTYISFLGSTRVSWILGKCLKHGIISLPNSFLFVLIHSTTLPFNFEGPYLGSSGVTLGIAEDSSIKDVTEALAYAPIHLTRTDYILYPWCSPTSWNIHNKFIVLC